MRSPLVLVPGLNCTAELFAPQLRHFSRRHPVMVGDHQKDDTIAAMAARILAAAPPRFALAGLSLGGYIAQEMVLQAPERIEKLALLDTRASPDTPEDAERRLMLIARAEAGELEQANEVLWVRLVHPARQEDAAMREIIFRMMRDTGAETFIRQQRAVIGRRDYRPFLSQMPAKTLVLVGEQDAITPLPMAEEMAASIPDAVKVVLPHCGHLSTLEAPRSVNAALDAWIAG